MGWGWSSIMPFHHGHPSWPFIMVMHDEHPSWCSIMVMHHDRPSWLPIMGEEGEVEEEEDEDRGGSGSSSQSRVASLSASFEEIWFSSDCGHGKSSIMVKTTKSEDSCRDSRCSIVNLYNCHQFWWFWRSKSKRDAAS